MMILGIDYGSRKIGLAYGDTHSRLAEPLTVLRVTSETDALEQIKKIIETHNIEEIVLGISENVMAENTRKFGEKLQNELGIIVVYQDETLTTQEAQSRSIAAGVPRKRRKDLEDAYAACLILQEYFDSNEY